MSEFRVGDRVRCASWEWGAGTVLDTSVGGVAGLVSVKWDPPHSWLGFYFRDHLVKIGERRVAWCNVYKPGDGATLIGFATEAEAKKFRIGNGSSPVRVEYDIPLPAVSESVKVGNRVSCKHTGFRGIVLAIDGKQAWVRWGIAGQHITLNVRDLSLDDGIGKKSYDGASDGWASALQQANCPPAAAGGGTAGAGA